MDLLRRTGAGELAGLLGAGLLDADRHIRPHQFRRRAQESLAALDAPDRALFEAYAEGVNAAIAVARRAAVRVPDAARDARALARRGFAPRRLCHVDRPAGTRRPQ